MRNRVQPNQQISGPFGALMGFWHSKWSHQVIALAMAGFVWIAFDLWARSHLPPLNRLTGNLAYVGVFVGWAAAYLLYRYRLAQGMKESAAWYHYMVHIIWVCSLMAIVAWWAQAPFADPERRTLGTFVTATLVAAGSIITVRPPSEGPMGWSGAVVPTVVPVGMMAYYLIQPGEEAMPIVPLLGIFCGLMLALRETILGSARQAHARVMEAEAAQREAQLARERFLVAASHDLSQPLQAARLSLDQALRAGDGSERKAAADRADWALDSMEAMVGQIMEHLKLESGSVAASTAPFAVVPLLERVSDLYELAVRKGRIALRIVAGRSQALGDPALVERIVGNLLANAIRHAKPNRILLATRCRGDRLRIWVIDDGVGLAEGERAGLFDDYVQGDHRGEIRGGYGLGLSSARRMAALMDGEVGHDPRWNRGCAFYLDLPRA